MSFTCNLVPTNIVVNQTTGFKGDIVNLTATIKDSSSLPLSGKTVNFSVNGTSVGQAITDASGIATYAYTIIQNGGTYTIMAEFLQDSIYATSNNTNILTVPFTPTALVVNPVNGFKGDIVNLIATLTDTHSNIPLSGKTIQFSVNGTPVGQAITDASGIATFAYTIIQNSGTYNILAEFLQDSILSGSTTTNYLKVNDILAVDNVNPANGAVNVSINQVFTITFDRIIQEGTEYASISLSGSKGAVIITKSTLNNILTIITTSNLDQGSLYTLCIPINAVTDTLGTTLKTNFISTFTTIDKIRPIINTIDPINSAVDILVNKVIRITFSEDIKAGSSGSYNSIYLRNSDGIYVILIKTITGNILTLTPTTNLKAGTTYTINIPQYSIADITGNTLLNTNTSIFTTIPDKIRPIINTIDPTNEAVNVQLNKVIRITFSEDIKAGNTGSYNSINIRNSDGTYITLTKIITNNILTLTPTTNLKAGTTYTINIPQYAIADITGNTLLNTYTSTFSTIENIRPTINTIDPTNEAVNVQLNKVITVTFSEDIKAGNTGSYNSINIRSSDGTYITLTKTITNNILTLTPTTNLKAGTTYTINIPQYSIADITGNTLLNTYTTTFSTA